MTTGLGATVVFMFALVGQLVAVRASSCAFEYRDDFVELSGRQNRSPHHRSVICCAVEVRQRKFDVLGVNFETDLDPANSISGDRCLAFV